MFENKEYYGDDKHNYLYRIYGIIGQKMQELETKRINMNKELRENPMKFGFDFWFTPMKYLEYEYEHEKQEKMKIETNSNERFINESGLKFNDISSEVERTYIFPNGNTLFIGNPLYLSVSPSGGHRLYTADNWCWYVQPKEGWAIKWKVKEGQPSFVK